MKIGVVSDSHGDIHALRSALKSIGDADLVIHLGDGINDIDAVSQYIKTEIIKVKGNCDFNSGLDAERIIMAENKRLLITHGHNYNVKSDYLNIHYKAIKEDAHMVLFGHTHFPEIIENNNIILFNPGSISKPRGTGRTYGIVIIEKGLIMPKIWDLHL
ncbi:phosphodiesterase YfcE [Oxobacter pfennigii]|uniref:Phosphoesterase n=1 Tax=Oxobacter pfennigii TaxID=36849 RepID=A0A0P8WTH9_9CLOT|nr:metallophosphoesterase [Oxobacter pfennigii]KPU45950.1 phosphodiesterase YfcE [Oxobacter pfennigii]